MDFHSHPWIGEMNVRKVVKGKGSEETEAINEDRNKHFVFLIYDN